MNKIRQDEEKGYRERKTKNGYKYLGENVDGKDIYEKDGTIYREEEHRYLVKTELEKINFKEANDEK